MGKTGLIIIFNHKYEKNIEKLKMIYGDKFGYIKFIMPFYNGSDPDVIPVYENSFQFEGYIAQAYRQFFDPVITHYAFIGDDLILNPELNESNFEHKFHLGRADSYFESFTKLNETAYWSYERFKDAELAFKQIGSSYKTEIPSKDEAIEIAGKYGLSDFSLSLASFTAATRKKQIKDNLKRRMRPFTLDYPLVTGYSDFFVVSKCDIENFCRLCGVFASMRLWVEIAIPTAIMLKCGNIKFQSDIDLKTEKMWKPEEFVQRFEMQCDYKLINLHKNWPGEYAYLHPVKLSKWK